MSQGAADDQWERLSGELSEAGFALEAILDGHGSSWVVAARRGGRCVVVKSPGLSVYAAGEAAALSAWTLTGAAVHVRERTSEGWLVLDHVPGRTLTEDEGAAWATAVGRSAHALHGVPVPEDLPGLDGALGAWLVDVLDPAVLPSPLAQWSHAAMHELVSLGVAGRDVLCHGDLAPRNLIVSDDGRLTVIDPWGVRAPAALDLAHYAFSCAADPRAVLRAILSGYPAAVPGLAHACVLAVATMLGYRLPRGMALGYRARAARQMMDAGSPDAWLGDISRRRART